MLITHLVYSASYRDLLGTAETILEMDSQMQSVETYLGDMGVRCNSRLLDKKAANLRAWNDDIKARGTPTVNPRFPIEEIAKAHTKIGRQGALRLGFTTGCATRLS